MANTNEKILEVKNLRVSFRTDGGTVKAVRGISFDLYKGRTLAIVGESGSGKSVTSKAILGILANNKIVEDGQIIYDGKDLLQINEDEFTKLRGVKLSMIFQDPLSALNPIMIVGKQLTEAIKLKNKADIKEANKLLKKYNKIFSSVDKSQASKLHKEASKSKWGDDVDLHDYESLFEGATRASVAAQKEAISGIITQLQSTLDEHFGHESTSVRDICDILTKLEKPLKACELSIAKEADNDILVFPNLVKHYKKASKDSLDYEKKLNKCFEKYNTNDFYALPVSVRAKLREVVITQEEHTTRLRNSLNELIDHLSALSSRSEADILALKDKLMEAYGSALLTSKSKLSKKEIKEKAIVTLGEVGINEPEKRFNQYPFELSGGMRQRIVIAIALCSSPEILICDEPTTALDVTIQSQILELINKLKAEKNLSIVFITHDLGVVANMADDIAVMYAGKIVEEGTSQDIFYDPRHPYTWALLGSVPDLKTKEKLDAIPGTPPDMLLPPKGDAFALRNKDALAIDSLMEPPFFEVSPTHKVATWNVYKDAEDVQAPKMVVSRIRNALKEHPEATPKPTNTKNSILNYLKEAK